MNNIYLDVLHPRRPPLNYVTPAICDAVFSSTSFPTLILNALPVRRAITGLHIRFIGETGDFELTWDNYPGVLCYSVYKLNDANDPFGDYTIIAECITDPLFRPDDWEPDFDPEEPGCYIVTAITAEGETALSDPICTDTNGDGIPDGFPNGGGCISNLTPLPDAELGVEYSVTFLPVGPAAGPLWTLTGGSAPDGLTLAIGTGVFSGIPTEGGEFDFTVRLTKDGGGFCEKTFHLTVTEVCCLENIVNIAPVSIVQGISYAVTDNRIVGSMGSVIGDEGIVFIDAGTDAILSTIAVVGATPAGSVYCPSNNRVYVVSSTSDEVLVVDPTLMVVESTISVGAGIFIYSPSYDETNDRIYIPGVATPSMDSIVISINPTLGTASTLITEAAAPPGESSNFRKRAAYCPVNDRIYVPHGYDDGLGNFIDSIRVYSSAGVFVESIAIPDSASADGNAQIFWSGDTGFLYYMGSSAVAGLSGTRVINPADNSTVTTLWGYLAFSFSPTCGTVCILSTDAGGLALQQYDPSDGHSLVCASSFFGFAVTGAIQTAAAANGKVYVPDYSSSIVRVFRPPE